MTPGRFHAMDAVRGIALLLGVVVHATMAYLPDPVSYGVVDGERSSTLAVLTFYLPNIFVMVTFFVVAGYFARKSLVRKGPLLFVFDRLRRVGVPLLASWLILAAVLLLPWFVIDAPRSDDARPVLSMWHLWFLYYLLMFYAAVLVIRGVVMAARATGERIDRWAGPLLGSVAAPAVLAAPLAVSLFFQDRWQWWWGILDPAVSFVPQVPALVGFGTAFGVGWLLHRQPDLLGVLETRWVLNLGVALACSAACLVIMGGVPDGEFAPGGVRMVAYAAFFAVAVWTWTFAFLGIALRYLAGFSVVRRYLADASYWIYLVHLPLLIPLQMVMTSVDWPWIAEYPLVLAITSVLSLLSYQLLVRDTPVGDFLHGKRDLVWTSRPTG